MVNLFAQVLILAFLIEGIIEYVLGVWWKPKQGEDRKKLLQGIGLILGIAICIVGKIDMLSVVGLKLGIAGNLLTGVAISRGSDYLHKFWRMLQEAGKSE